MLHLTKKLAIQFRTNSFAEIERQAQDRREAAEQASPFPFAPGTPLAECLAYVPNFGGNPQTDTLMIQLTLAGQADYHRRALPNTEASRILLAQYAKHAQVCGGLAEQVQS